MVGAKQEKIGKTIFMLYKLNQFTSLSDLSICNERVPAEQ